ncbi:hypothetical protein P886_1256 [Alteromonadaceae bacterium 2753L.S.0a.02]|nr:hypothetical protein P886_1256 [Alteromonadaceae bacterium 2753L.S.0a.02]
MIWEDLIVILIDKLLIGILILIVGLWINRKLHDYRVGLEENVGTRVRIAERRLPSYRKLWEITQPTSRAREQALTPQERKELYVALWQWYYEAGNGIFLSNETRELYLDAREALIRESTENSDIIKLFSGLRTAIKNEIGIYGTKVQ